MWFTGVMKCICGLLVLGDVYVVYWRYEMYMWFIGVRRCICGLLAL